VDPWIRGPVDPWTRGPVSLSIVFDKEGF